MKAARGVTGDIALTVVLTVIAVIGTLRADAFTHAERDLDALGLSLVVLTALTVAIRRTRPLEALLLAAAFAGTYLALGYTYGPILLPFLVCVYSLARYRPLATAVPGAAIALGAVMVHVFTNDRALDGFVAVVPASAWVVVPFAVGVTVRTTRAGAAQARAEAIRQRVDDERLRVAQEVHDVVGHGLAAISMQANVALHVLPKDPSQAETALEAISRTSAQALEELRATLTTVRRTGSGAPRTVAPGLDGVEELCGRMRAAGAHVVLQVTGQVRPLPVPVELAGYRVVQESLTNVLRHSHRATAVVHVQYDGAHVTISVTNPVASPVPRSTAGLGLAGMRERVEALGGTFAAGPADDGRFEVRAVIPIGEEET